MSAEKKKQRLVIKKCDMFATPESWANLESWIERHAPIDALHITTGVWMALNFLVEKEKAGELLISTEER